MATATAEILHHAGPWYLVRIAYGTHDSYQIHEIGRVRYGCTLEPLRAFVCDPAEVVLTVPALKVRSVDLEDYVTDIAELAAAASELQKAINGDIATRNPQDKQK